MRQKPYVHQGLQGYDLLAFPLERPFNGPPRIIERFPDFDLGLASREGLVATGVAVAGGFLFLRWYLGGWPVSRWDEEERLMRERDPAANEARLVTLLFLDMGNVCLDGRGGVVGGVGTVAVTLARAGKGEVNGVASRGTGVGVIDLTSSSMSIGITSFALPL